MRQEQRTDVAGRVAHTAKIPQAVGTCVHDEQLATGDNGHAGPGSFWCRQRAPGAAQGNMKAVGKVCGDICTDAACHTALEDALDQGRALAVDQQSDSGQYDNDDDFLHVTHLPAGLLLMAGMMP